MSNNDFYQIRLPHIIKPFYIYKRYETQRNITRLEMVPLTVGEKWYLRLILYKVPVLSFKDARTVNGITYQSFQLAALARNLVEDEDEAMTAFLWAISYSTPAELRILFIIMTTQGFPTLKIYENTELRNKLMEDFIINSNNNMR